jgi:hypothetical protein
VNHIVSIRKLTTAAGSFLGSLALSPVKVFAQGPLEDTVNINPRDAQFQNLQNLKPSNFVSATINLLLGIAGIVAFIFLLWGGLQWILAGGDKEGTEKARKKITSALIGLAIVFSAYALLFIVRALFGIDLVAVNLGRIF